MLLNIDVIDPVKINTYTKYKDMSLVVKDPCSICNALVSTVTEISITELCYEPFIEDGIKHNHNGNKITGNGVCVNGHVLTNIVLYDMCICGWPTNSKKVIDLQTKLIAKHLCSICNTLVSNVKETLSTVVYYRPYVDSDNKRHTHNQNLIRGSGACVNGHVLDNIELCYKCECGWPEGTGLPAKLLNTHTHTFNTDQCCICAAETTAVDYTLRNTDNDTNDTIYTLVKCTNGHQTSQRCAYTCGPPCYIDKLRKNLSALQHTLPQTIPLPISPQAIPPPTLPVRSTAMPPPTLPVRSTAMPHALLDAIDAGLKL